MRTHTRPFRWGIAYPANLMVRCRGLRQDVCDGRLFLPRSSGRRSAAHRRVARNGSSPATRTHPLRPAHPVHPTSLCRYRQLEAMSSKIPKILRVTLIADRPARRSTWLRPLAAVRFRGVDRGGSEADGVERGAGGAKGAMQPGGCGDAAMGGGALHVPSRPGVHRDVWYPLTTDSDTAREPQMQPPPVGERIATIPAQSSRSLPDPDDC